MWHLKYQLVGTDNDFISIATTRPETMLGDGAVAVNLKMTVSASDWQNGDLAAVKPPYSIIGDDYAKMDKGSGAVKITAST